MAKKRAEKKLPKQIADKIAGEPWYVSPGLIHAMQVGESAIVGPCSPHDIGATACRAGVKVTQHQLYVLDPTLLRTIKMFLVTRLE